MKANSILVLAVFLFQLPIMLIAQTKDLFAYENGDIIPKRESFSPLAKESAPFGNSAEVYVHKKLLRALFRPLMTR